TCSMASRPLRSDATTCRPVSESIQRAMRPRTTMASSTTITRRADCPMAGGGGVATAIFIAAHGAPRHRRPCTRAQGAGRCRRSNQADFLKLGFDDFLVERLHDILIRAPMQGARNMRDVVFCGEDNHLR